MSIAEQVRLEAVEREVQDLRTSVLELQSLIAELREAASERRNVLTLKKGDKRG
ncbi:MAG TPA: hypothetical protein VF217_03515 [Rhodanobacteraceae bacterium]